MNAVTSNAVYEALLSKATTHFYGQFQETNRTIFISVPDQSFLLVAGYTTAGYTCVGLYFVTRRAVDGKQVATVMNKNLGEVEAPFEIWANDDDGNNQIRLYSGREAMMGTGVWSLTFSA